MIKVLFENHHLYYLPNFIPIIDVMNKRNGYDVYTSIPAMMPKDEKNIFINACQTLNIKMILFEDENERSNSKSSKILFPFLELANYFQYLYFK